MTISDEERARLNREFWKGVQYAAEKCDRKSFELDLGSAAHDALKSVANELYASVLRTQGSLNLPGVPSPERSVKSELIEILSHPDMAKIIDSMISTVARREVANLLEEALGKAADHHPGETENGGDSS